MLIGINRKPASTTETTLDRMESSKIPFFLTGSRYFGWEKPESDWDFFSQDARGTITTLGLLGFMENVSEGYQDGLTRKVFIRHSIHVQLVTSTIAKQELNQFFNRNKRLLAVPSYDHHFKLLWAPRSKAEQKAAWQTAITMFLSRSLLSGH